jgi:hypothetical protein
MATRQSRSTSAPANPHSIPAAVRPAADAAADAFDDLDGGAPAPKKSGKSGDRPTLPLPPQVVEAFKRYVGAKVLEEIVTERQKNAENEVSEACFDLYVEGLWQHKKQPTNPGLKLNNDRGQPDLEAMFQVQDRFTKNNIHLPEPETDKDGNPVETLQQATVKLLVGLGLEKDLAEKFLAEEVDMRPVKSLRAFNELIFGHYQGKDWVDATPEEKAVGQKLMDFVKTLPPEERKLVLKTEPQVTVKKDVIGRLPFYAKCAAHVKALLKVFTPVYFCSKAKLGISDTPQQKVDRLGDIAKDIIGKKLLG